MYPRLILLMSSGSKKEPRYVDRRSWSATELFREFRVVVKFSSKIPSSHFKIQGARRVTRSKVRIEGPKIRGATVKISVSKAVWPLRFVHPWKWGRRCYLSWLNWSTSPAFPWTDWEKPRESSVTFVDIRVATSIQSSLYLPLLLPLSSPPSLEQDEVSSVYQRH
jgi:hypothetical protein